MEDIAISKFEFWCPLEINKAIDEKTGNEVMRLGGIASTIDKDSDGEYLDPKGFDIKPLMESGLVNWHHQAKTNPGTIVGEPSKAEIRKDGLYIETDLYPSSPIARDIWELAQTLEKDSKTRRLGYSIEGKVVKRKSNDKNSPDYKKIEKAIITGVAITHMPKNPKTFAEIIKGEIDDEETIEDEETKDEVSKEQETSSENVSDSSDDKKLDTDKGRALIKEDVDDKLKIQTFGKAEVMERLFLDLPGISIEKANEIYLLINNIKNMSKRKQITEEDIEKAYGALGLSAPDYLSKANEDDDTDETETDEEEEVEVEEDDEPKKDTDDDQDKDDDDDDDSTEKADVLDRLSSIEKAISNSFNGSVNYFKALGVLVKEQNEKFEKAVNNLEIANSRIDELVEINKAQSETISDLMSQIEAFGNSTPAPKSIRHAAPVERSFGKANNNDFEKGETETAPNRVSIKNRSVVSEILDQATFAKGYDAEFSNACTQFEASHVLPKNIIGRIKSEFGIEIVD